MNVMFKPSNLFFGILHWFLRPCVMRASLPSEMVPLEICRAELDLQGWGILKVWSDDAPLLKTFFSGSPQIAFNAPINHQIHISVWNLYGKRQYVLDTRTARDERWVNPNRLFQHHNAQSLKLKPLPKEKELAQWLNPVLKPPPQPSKQFAAVNPSHVWSAKAHIPASQPIDVTALKRPTLTFDSPRVKLSLDELQQRENRISILRTPGP